MDKAKFREEIIKDVWEWYSKKYEGKTGQLKISVSDLIADFIIDSRYIKIGIIEPLEVNCNIKFPPLDGERKYC